MSERVPVRLPERIFLRRVDVNDLDWDGAEGDVHCLYSPKTIIATHMDAFIPEARHKELLERAVGEARRVALIDAFNVCAGQQLGGEHFEYDHAVDVCAGAIGRLQVKHAKESARAASSPGDEERK